MKIIVTYFTDKELYYFELPYGEWVVNNKKYTVSNYQADKINSLLEPEIFKVNKSTNIKYYENVSEPNMHKLGVDAYQHDLSMLKSKGKPYYDNEDGDFYFDKLEDEFAYKKFLRDWKPIFEEVVSKEKVDIEIRHAMLDTGNEFIKPLFCVDSTKPELVQVMFAAYQMKIVKDWCNKHVPDAYEIPNHSHLEYAKISGQYVFTGTKTEFNGQHPVRVMHYDEAVKLLDNEKKKIEGILYSLLCKIKAIPDVTVKQLINEIENVRRQVSEKKYSSKSSKVVMCDEVSKDLQKIVTRLQNLSTELQTGV